MIPFCLFQCNSNRMSAAAFGPVQAPSDACPARPRSPHGRRALAAPTRRCAVTDDTPPQMLHRPRRCAVPTIRHYRCHTTHDAAPPSTLHRHRRRCAVPTIRCHRCYTTPDATPPSPLRRPDDTLPQMLHHPRRYTALAAAPSRRYTATDATPPPMLHHPRRCAATDATLPRYYALPPSPHGKPYLI